MMTDEASRTTQTKRETIQIRMSPDEKKAFAQAAKISGISVSAWVRERLRRAAAQELELVGQRAAFVERLTMRPADE